MKSIAVFVPEKHVSHSTDSASLTTNYSLQTKQGSLPSTLVLTLPSLSLLSAGHAHMPVRCSLPVKLSKKERNISRKETLPWTLEAENLAVFSVHRNASHALRYLVSPLSSTAVLASAKTSAAISPTSAVFSWQSNSGSGTRKVSTLGFCVHTDFTPITVGLSRRQVSRARLSLSLPSSKITFSRPFKEKRISEVERIGSINHPSFE